MRRDYLHGRLDESSAPRGWLEQFQLWFADASADPAITEVNAMQVATVGADGCPSVRTVLLKGLDERGVVFYTNFDSAKAHDLDSKPQAAAVFAWLAHERQVRISGPVSRVEQEQTDAYFASRPRGSQIGAWASPQSSVISSRASLEAAVAEIEARFAGMQVPTPPGWGGFRIAPQTVEFWQGRADRLHDRLRYRSDLAGGAEGGWAIERLAP
ncbi:MAG: pyridoxamine 5'-phosphate oxidase [Actinomycetota bacterium]|nr:pyridoxamine 5'-phosphate oxidase [Actinomycetota bacterium]